MAKATNTPTTVDPSADASIVDAERKQVGKRLADAYLQAVETINRATIGPNKRRMPLKCPTFRPKGEAAIGSDDSCPMAYANKVGEYSALFGQCVQSLHAVHAALVEASRVYADGDTVSGFGTRGSRIPLIREHARTLMAFTTNTLSQNASARLEDAFAVIR